MDLATYFGIIEYLLMASTFVAIVLIFLYVYYGKEEQKPKE
jgi:hypothetical protein